MFLTGGERWRVLRLHVEDQIPLTALARETGISTRTLQRWLRLYRLVARVLSSCDRAPMPARGA
ncbi:helix-turn-helix domain-containing protein [Arthrobacter sp. SLBN-112]|uniref:helix-turn-helix domain-containing protein n=1 Tax=Arthrobacter sp. SLBN-112 TaxID=2768452 RepID=UPI002E11A8E6